MKAHRDPECRAVASQAPPEWGRGTERGAHSGILGKRLHGLPLWTATGVDVDGVVGHAFLAHQVQEPDEALVGHVLIGSDEAGHVVARCVGFGLGLGDGGAQAPVRSPRSHRLLVCRLPEAADPRRCPPRSGQSAASGSLTWIELLAMSTAVTMKMISTTKVMSPASDIDGGDDLVIAAAELPGQLRPPFGQRAFALVRLDAGEDQVERLSTRARMLLFLDWKKLKSTTAGMAPKGQWRSLRALQRCLPSQRCSPRSKSPGRRRP